jgi:hypothetical protein
MIFSKRSSVTIFVTMAMIRIAKRDGPTKYEDSVFNEEVFMYSSSRDNGL